MLTSPGGRQPCPTPNTLSQPGELVPGLSTLTARMFRSQRAGREGEGWSETEGDPAWILYLPSGWAKQKTDSMSVRVLGEEVATMVGARGSSWPADAHQLRGRGPAARKVGEGREAAGETVLLLCLLADPCPCGFAPTRPAGPRSQDGALPLPEQQLHSAAPGLSSHL